MAKECLPAVLPNNTVPFSSTINPRLSKYIANISTPERPVNQSTAVGDGETEAQRLAQGHTVNPYQG